MTSYMVLMSAILGTAFLCSLPAAAAEEAAVEAGPNLPVVGTDGNPVVRESTEWAQINCPLSADAKTPRVLLIGDSISVNYAGGVREGLKGKYHVDNLGTSRSVNDPVLQTQIYSFLQEHRYTLIYFNNGLHGGHQTPEQYASGLRVLTQYLKDNSHSAKLVFATSTPVSQKVEGVAQLSEKNKNVMARNELARALMKELAIQVGDLYGLMVGHIDLHRDGVHFSAEGNVLLSQHITETILEALSSAPPAAPE